MIVVHIIGQDGTWKSLLRFSTQIMTLSGIWTFNATESGREYSVGFACQQIAELLWLVSDTKQMVLKTSAISVILAMCLKQLMLDVG